jgi:DNA-binding beta-propeller fold protein YncE
MQRRDFLSRSALAAMLASGVAPAAVTARDKSDKTNPVIGDGDHKYECNHNWGELPRSLVWQTTHGVCVDGEGLIYVKMQGHGKPQDTIVVFDKKGKFVRSFGKEYHGGGHGIDLRKEDGKEYLYLCDTAHGGVVVKTDLNGEHVWTKKGPPEEAKYGKGARYSPTNVAFNPDGGFYVADGYGSNFIHQFDKDAKYVRTFSGSGLDFGKTRTPHGIWLDDRKGRKPTLIVADRANARLQYFTLDGKHAGFVHDVLFPAHFDTRGDVLLVPDLHARVSLFDKDNAPIVHLGDDLAWRKKALAGFQARQKPEDCPAGKFIHPHDACFDADGNIFVVEWVQTGRLSLLKKV